MRSFMLIAALAIVGPATDCRAAGSPVQDIRDLAAAVTAMPDVKWQDFRVVSFSGLEHVDAAHVAVRFATETLNTRTRQANFRLINENLWAIDTKALGWPASAWDEMSREWVYYSSLEEHAPKEIALLAEKMGTKFPIMRADLFVKQAWEPEWYVKLLNLPATREELYKQELIDLKTAPLVAVVSEDLSVSKHPRKIAWVETKDGRMAWVSMGYKNCRGENDSTRHPDNFDCDYNEIAIEMPNGLDKYFANDGKTGKRLGGQAFGERDLPTDVVEDHTATGPQVLLGVSCVSCHAAGVKNLGHAARFASLDFTGSKEPMSKLFDKYNVDDIAEKSDDATARWQASLWRLTRRTPDANQKAWRQVFADYEAPVTQATAAREVGTSDEAIAKVADRWPVDRSEWEHLYPVALRISQRR